MNGQSPERLVEALRPYVGGTDQYARELAPNFMISPELLHAATLAGKPDEGEFRLRKADGSEVKRMLEASSDKGEPSARTVWPKRDLSPVPPIGSDTGWVHVLDGVEAPRHLSRPDENFWHSYLETDDILYVQINRFRDQEARPMSDYLSDLLAEAGKRKVKHAIVDLRYSPGGNYMLATDFSRLLPEAVPNGRIFILTSGNTFSAAISIASRLKYYSGGRAVLVGEEMGDAGQMWGEGGTTIMPNSKIAFRYTTAYHDWEKGCSLLQIGTCFFLNYFYGTAAGSLLPEVPVAQTFASYAAGDDAVMSEVLRMAKQGK
ncbi:peptidase S41-like protein [Aminobacter sp. AP02]|nr:peptidase S41-like protein [Aminobacter sp. AP02]